MSYRAYIFSRKTFHGNCSHWYNIVLSFYSTNDLDICVNNLGVGFPTFKSWTKWILSSFGPVNLVISSVHSTNALSFVVVTTLIQTFISFVKCVISSSSRCIKLLKKCSLPRASTVTLRSHFEVKCKNVQTGAFKCSVVSFPSQYTVSCFYFALYAVHHCSFYLK